VASKSGARLFLGNINAAESAEHCERHNLTHILTVMELFGGAVNLPANFTGMHKVIDVGDMPSCNLLMHLPEAFEFLDKALSSPTSNVLVHCQMGQSRSATVVIGYLMCCERVSLDMEYRVVSNQRPSINPNKGFIEQLQFLEQHKFDTKKASDAFDDLCLSGAKGMYAKRCVLLRQMKDVPPVVEDERTADEIVEGLIRNPALGFMFVQANADLMEQWRLSGCSRMTWFLERLFTHIPQNFRGISTKDLQKVQHQLAMEVEIALEGAENGVGASVLGGRAAEVTPSPMELPSVAPLHRHHTPLRVRQP